MIKSFLIASITFFVVLIALLFIPAKNNQVNFFGLPSPSTETIADTISTHPNENLLLLGKDSEVVTYEEVSDLTQAELDFFYSYDSL